MFGATAAPASVSTRYLTPAVLGTALSTTQGAHVVMPMAGTIQCLYVTHDTAISGSNMTYTVQVNDVDVAAVVTINTTLTAGNVTGLSVAFAAGSKVSIKCVESGTTAQAALNARATIGGIWS
jgi:hypothetical protein